VKTLNNPRSLLAVFLLAMLVSTLIPHVYSSTLTLSVFTTKPSYLIADDITVYGILTYNDSPVPNWPVAIEVQDPLGTPVVTRTAQTNTSGTYAVTFKLPTNAELGTYTAYISSGYKGETATNNTTFEVIPIRDIAVTNAASSKTVVGQGYSVNVTVIVDNQGEPTETFNVTVYCNETAITLPSGENYTTVALASGESTSVVITWPVQGETDTTDNNLTVGWVLVTIPGDVDGDLENGRYDVDLFDAVRLLACYGAKEGEPSFDPNCDIDNDGRVFLFDAVILLSRYGQKYP
jgi:hypothetical protein